MTGLFLEVEPTIGGASHSRPTASAQSWPHRLHCRDNGLRPIPRFLISYPTAVALANAKEFAQMADLDRLEKLQVRMERHRANGELDDYFEINQQIHRLVVVGARNPVLTETHGWLLGRLERARYLALSAEGRWEQSMLEHREILEALKHGNSERAGRLFATHVERTGFIVTAIAGSGSFARAGRKASRPRIPFGRQHNGMTMRILLLNPNISVTDADGIRNLRCRFQHAVALADRAAGLPVCFRHGRSADRWRTSTGNTGRTSLRHGCRDHRRLRRSRPVCRARAVRFPGDRHVGSGDADRLHDGTPFRHRHLFAGSAPGIRDCVEMHGLTGRCSGIRSLSKSFSSIASVQAENGDALVDLANKAVDEDGADVIVLAGAPLAGLAAQASSRIPVPVVDPIAAAVKQAEALLALAPRKALAGSSRRPAAKPTAGLSPALASCS
jgi:hypothetical protein